MAKNSRDYWKEREEEARKHTIQDEEVYNREIKRIYQRMYDNINREVNGFFVRYAGREGISISEAKKRVSKLDMEEYSRKAKEYVKNKDFSRQANEEMRIYNLTMKVNRLEMLKAHMGLEMVNSYQDLEDYMGRALNETTMKELERQAGILGDSVSNPQRFAKQIVDGSFHHAKWSDRIWSNQQTLKMKLYDNLQVGLIQGRNPNVLARDIMKTMGASVNDASRLMRTEMCRVQTDAQMATLAANGFEDYEFIAERSSRTCDQCLAMDGKHFKVKDAMPGENAPPLHPNCRCGTAAWMDDKAYEEWLDSGAAADGVSFKDFSANYKAAGETGLGVEEWAGSNAETFRKMSRGDDLGDDSIPKGSELSKGVKDDLVAYANKRRINIHGINQFDGDPELLKAVMDELHSHKSMFPRVFSGKRITLEFEDGEIGTYAITDKKTIRLNRMYFRNRAFTENDMVKAEKFVNPTLEGIIRHELGHIVEHVHGEKGLQFARQAYYNIHNKEPNKIELMKYIQKNISAYAYPEQADSITGYRYYSPHEITSEVLSAKKDTKFIKLIKEMWEKEGLK